MTENNKSSQALYSDPQSGLEMMMDIVVQMNVDGKNFALLTPSTPTVSLLARGPAGEEDDDAENHPDEHVGEIEEVEDELFKSLTPQLNQELAKWKVEVKKNGDLWTLSGDLPDEAFEDLEVIYLHEECEHTHQHQHTDGQVHEHSHSHECEHHHSHGEPGEEEEENAEAYHLLAEVVKEGMRYWMLMPIAPDLFAVEIMGDKTRPLEDEEANKLVDKFQTAMEKLSSEVGEE